MVTVAQAEQIIAQQTRDYGEEYLGYDLAMGRMLAEELIADRDLPPYNRVTMDGIAISFSGYANGGRSFEVVATQAAGDKPAAITAENQCVEIMTGAALPDSVDTIVRYEDLRMENGAATILIDTVKRGQNVHLRGKDKKQGDVVAAAGQMVSPAIISMAASVGVSKLAVKKLPKVVIVSTGDELVGIDETHNPYQIRRSNSYTIKHALQQYGIVADLIHIPDDPDATFAHLQKALDTYDVLLLSGGVSMGKYDYVPSALGRLGVTPGFYKVQQRPGKPFWFGAHSGGQLVFAFPGNPVSAFLCLYRYFLPWLRCITGSNAQPIYAALAADVVFTPKLQYFLQVHVAVSEAGMLIATPVDGNGSGDFSNLVATNAFMELPMEVTTFTAGSVYPIWPFKSIV